MERILKVTKQANYLIKSQKEERETMKTLSIDIQAEKSVLGAMLLDTKAIEYAIEHLNKDCFYEKRYQLLFKSITDLFCTTGVCDSTTLFAYLKNKKILEICGGQTEIGKLINSVPTHRHILQYSKILLDKYKRRKLIENAEDIKHKAIDSKISPQDILTESTNKLFSLALWASKTDFKSSNEIIKDVNTHIELAKQGKLEQLFIPTGFYSLDNIISGLQKSCLIIIAGRTSMGKTAFALNIAKNLAIDRNIPVGIFTLEMDGKQFMFRLISDLCKIEQKHIYQGNLKPNDYTKLFNASDKIANSPLFIDETPDNTINSIMYKAKKLVRTHKIQLLIIDYVQLISSRGMEKTPRYEQLNIISKYLKQLAKELNIPIMILAQLNRQVEGRDKKIPQLFDLKESGGLEENADVVLLLYRPDYYKKSERPDELDVYIAKNRNGATGKITLSFEKSYNSFDDLTA